MSWIVQTADDESTGQVKDILKAAKTADYESSGQVKDILKAAKVSVTTAGAHEVEQEAVSSDDEIWIVQTADYESSGQVKDILKAAKVSVTTAGAHEVEQEAVSSDDEIWIVQTADDESTGQVMDILKAAKCTGTFPTETQLFDHVHFIHEKTKKWQCPIKDCGKTFYLRATLTKHSRSHTDTRRYGCVTCGKRFLDKQTLDEHGVTHLQGNTDVTQPLAHRHAAERLCDVRQAVP
ncbi:Zinc finger protein 41 [Operophtera brumata]|uniref:Zinc finger protein 41 n=1 Tax=Operophtera brumata TaxID=104452 RepID=A0A0L7LB73_OPEBR|nr:Zinc finger protein 41 [Operophtera brumata]